MGNHSSSVVYPEVALHLVDVSFLTLRTAAVNSVMRRNENAYLSSAVVLHLGNLRPKEAGSLVGYEGIGWGFALGGWYACLGFGGGALGTRACHSVGLFSLGHGLPMLRRLPEEALPNRLPNGWLWLPAGESGHF